MEKHWLKSYPPGVPEFIDSRAYVSLVDFFDQSCQRFAHLPALYDRGVRLTYKQLSEQVNALAAFFQQAWQCQRNERIALMVPNMLQYPIVFFAILKAGGVVVNMNPLYTVPEIVAQLSNAGAHKVVVCDVFAHKIATTHTQYPLSAVMVVRLSDLLSPLRSLLTRVVVRYAKKLVPAYHLPQAVYFNEARKNSYTLQFVEHKPDDLALLQYTGGTTGVSKGAMLTHGNLVSNILQACAWVNPVTRVGQEVILTALPLYHIFALTANLLVGMATGSMLLLIIDPRNIKNVLNTLKKVPCTAMTGVDTLYRALLHAPAFAKLNFENFRWAIAGGMPLSDFVAKRFLAVVGQPILEGYGLTEASPIVAVAPLRTNPSEELRPAAVLPLPATEIKIVDDDGVELVVGEVGELVVRGPQVMRGYWQSSAETTQVLQDGWLKTGDLAKVDADGFLYIVGRKKYLIIVSGFKVSPEEVERVISLMPQVADVVVVADHDDLGRELVKALIVKKDPVVTAAAIVAFCRERLTNYKVPHRIEFRESLPKTTLGKVARKNLN